MSSAVPFDGQPKLDDFKPRVTISDPLLSNVKVELVNHGLWRDFFRDGTEMIVTKHGRRMFPDLKFKITGLDPNSYYFILMDIVPFDDYRYKFVGTCWMPAFKSDSPKNNQNLYTHPDSPSLGSKWQSKAIGFTKLKLTNATGGPDDHLILNSMHRYTPRLHIFRGSDIALLHQRKFTTFVFPETTFIAVTAYQNEKITLLKIKYNPFAKGFREDDRRQALKRTASCEDQPTASRRQSVTSSSSSPDISTFPSSNTPSPVLQRPALHPPFTLPPFSCAPAIPSLPTAQIPTSSSSPPYASLPEPPVAVSQPTYFDFLGPYDNMLSFRPYYNIPRAWFPGPPPGITATGLPRPSGLPPPPSTSPAGLPAPARLPASLPTPPPPQPITSALPYPFMAFTPQISFSNLGAAANLLNPASSH